MNLKNTVIAGAMVCMMGSPAFADTFAGKIAFKNAGGDIVMKKGVVDLSPTEISAIKLKIAGIENLAQKVRVKKLAMENRTIVLALFRDIREMPADMAVIIKGSLIEGNNGHLFFGEVFTRECKEKAEHTEDSLLDRLLEGAQELQDESGCTIEFRGGLVATRKGKVDQGQHDQVQQDQDQAQQDQDQVQQDQDQVQQDQDQDQAQN